jgi:hypothetical protein
MTGLDMSGHIDDTFQSVAANRTSKSGGGYVDGRWVEGTITISPHKINLQPLNNKEIQALQVGAERIGDMRKIYVNDGDLYSIAEADTWEFATVDGAFKCVMLDNRPWRNYCKAIVSRKDDS